MEQTVNKFSVRRRLNSFSYAFKGIHHFFKTQHNSWIHATASVITVILGVMCELTAVEWCVIIFCNAIVFTAEMLNTAIEWTIDLVSPAYNPLAGKIKDLAAAGVLMSAAGAAIVGLIIFLPKIFKLLADAA